jgi:hypothetical protein
MMAEPPTTPIRVSVALPSLKSDEHRTLFSPQSTGRALVKIQRDFRDLKVWKLNSIPQPVPVLF